MVMRKEPEPRLGPDSPIDRDGDAIRKIDELPAQPPEIMRHFSYAHLPARLQLYSEPFCRLAETIVAMCPDNEQRAVALQKLLEAKDAAVRAAL